MNCHYQRCWKTYNKINDILTFLLKIIRKLCKCLLIIFSKFMGELNQDVFLRLPFKCDTNSVYTKPYICPHEI